MHKNKFFQLRNTSFLGIKSSHWSKSLFVLWLLCCTTLFAAQADVKLKPYQDYIKKYAPDAMRQQIKYGIPASITLAQGLLESGAGNSELARKSNNHFGIKCHSSWDGPSVKYFDDGEMSCFRKYRTVLDSYNDHSLFLVTRSRYDFLFDLNVKDYKGWARGLKKAGYATDKQYAKKLIRIIELYELNEYTKLACNPRKARRLMRQWEDEPKVEAPKPEKVETVKPVKEEQPKTEKVRPERPERPEKPARPEKAEKPEKQALPKAATKRLEVVQQAKDYHALALSSQQQEGPRTLTAESRHEIQYKGSVPYIVARYGDNYKTIANEFNISPARLRQINEWPKQHQIAPGDMVFLNRKDKVWDGESATHRVKDGDSMYSIAQQYGLRLASLYELNGMQWGDAIYIGQELKLR